MKLKTNTENLFYIKNPCNNIIHRYITESYKSENVKVLKKLWSR